MKIIYADIQKLKKFYGKDFFISYADRELKNEKRFWEYTVGRFLVKFAAEKYFGIKDTEIIIEKSGKPVFKNADLHFSISHSRNFVIVCVDQNPCGIDIEHIKPRNLEKFSKHYGQNFDTLEDFYKFWTFKEAKYKIGDIKTNCYSAKFQDNYYLTVLAKDICDIEDFLCKKCL